MANNYGGGPFPGCCVSNKVTERSNPKTWGRTYLYVASNEKKPKFSMNRISPYKGNKVTFYFIDATLHLREAYPDAWKKHEKLMEDRENLFDFKVGDVVCWPEYDGPNGRRVVLAVSKYTVTVTMNNRTTADMGHTTISIFNIWRK